MSRAGRKQRKKETGVLNSRQRNAIAIALIKIEWLDDDDELSNLGRRGGLVVAWRVGCCMEEGWVSDPDRVSGVATNPVAIKKSRGEGIWSQ